MIKLDGQIIALKLFSAIYTTSVANELENVSPDNYNSLADSSVLIKGFLLKHSAPLMKPTRKNKKCGKVFIKLPEDIKKHGLMAGHKKPYTSVKAQVLYSGSLSRKFDILQGTGQGRIPVLFMYKAYSNGLSNELTQHSFALSLNSISLASPSFADDISLLSIYPTFLSTSMNHCHAYSIKWRYKFDHVKSGIVTFGEYKRVHSEAMKERTWV